MKTVYVVDNSGISSVTAVRETQFYYYVDPSTKKQVIGKYATFYVSRLDKGRYNVFESLDAAWDWRLQHKRKALFVLRERLLNLEREIAALETERQEGHP